MVAELRTRPRCVLVFEHVYGKSLTGVPDCRKNAVPARSIMYANRGRALHSIHRQQ